MSTDRQAKRCPQCGTMTWTETSICQTCGHQFRSGVTQPTFNPERTQMLTLPPTVFQPPPTQQAVSHEPVNYIEPVLRPRHAKTPFVAVLIAALVLLIAAFYWVLR